MGKIKSIFYILTTILEILLLIGAYMVNSFTNKKMGMSRHVIHKNYVWENQYPITNIQYTYIVALILLAIFVLVLYIKRKNILRKIVTVMSITMVISVVLFTGFTLIYSTEEIRAFYYISFILGLATLIQIIKTLIGVVWYNVSK